MEFTDSTQQAAPPATATVADTVAPTDTDAPTDTAGAQSAAAGAAQEGEGESQEDRIAWLRDRCVRVQGVGVIGTTIG
jgi:hypothetical protein